MTVDSPQPGALPICGYPGCSRESEFRCVVCKKYFCAFHTYGQGGYVCKTDFNEPQFVDEHAPKNAMRFDKLEAFFERLFRPRR